MRQEEKDCVKVQEVVELCINSIYELITVFIVQLQSKTAFFLFKESNRFSLCLLVLRCLIKWVGHQSAMILDKTCSLYI